METQEPFDVRAVPTHAERIREEATRHHINSIMHRFSAATPSLPASVQALHHWLALQEARMARECRIAADELDGQRALPLAEVGS